MKQTTPEFLGKIEFCDQYQVKGWALNANAPNQPVYVEVCIGDRVIDQLSPFVFRWDLMTQGHGNGHHGFVYPIPEDYRDGNYYELRFRFAETGEELQGGQVGIRYLDESDHVPFHTTSLTGHRVLVLAPHPDDESLACGGSLILHRKAGDAVKVVFLTDGSRGDYAAAHDTEEYIELRKREAQKACSLLGIDDLEFWGVPDRHLGQDPATTNRLALLLRDYTPSLIYAPSPLEFHPDHRAAANMAWQAIQDTQPDTAVAFYELNRPIKTNTLVDISDVVDRKKEACTIYESQLAHAPYTDICLSLNRYRALTVSATCQYAEGFYVLESDRIVQSPIEQFAVQQVIPSAASQKKDGRPLVSIIVRTKDRLPLLRQALSSIVTQTYSPIEVVVIDDGGDDTSAVTQEFEGYLTMQTIRHDASKGRAGAANSGLRAARGKYITFLDNDDIIYPRHIDKLASYLEATGVECAYSDCEMGHYKWSENQGLSLVKSKEPYMGVDFDRDRLCVNNFIPIMTAMFTRGIATQVGFFDESLEAFEDWDYWIRMAEHTSLHRVNGITAEYRVFTGDRHDFLHWRSEIYNKHKDFWSVENVAQSIWGRLASLEQENMELRDTLATQRQEYSASARCSNNDSERPPREESSSRNHLAKRLEQAAKKFKLKIF